MSKKDSKGGKKGKEVVVKQEFAPPREPILKPKLTIDQELEEIRAAYNSKGADYFPPELAEKIKKIINLFSKKDENYVQYSELKDILQATNSVYVDEELLKGLYDRLSRQEGMSMDNVFLVLTKKYKDSDKKKDLMDAFTFINQFSPPLETEEECMMGSEKFYDHLLYNGYKYTDDMADATIKEADPKAKGMFSYAGFIDNILKTDKKKKKGGKKKKK
jgi:Ca2+-binding EF-hand superfamily protein